MGNAKERPLKKEKLIATFLYCFVLAILLTLITVKPAVTIFENRETLFSGGYSKNYESFRKLYYSSQYVKKENPGIIPDQTLESFAGGIFLKGINPILIIHDQPPLGRYIIALSIKLFDNPGTILVPLLAFSLIGIFLLGRMALQSAVLSLIPIAIFGNEPLFLNKLSIVPLLEPIQLPFIIFALYFFVKGIKAKKQSLYWFIATSVMLGFVISVRFFVLGVFLLATMITFFMLQRLTKNKIIPFLVSLPLSLVVLVLSYLRTLQFGYSILHIFGIQKYIFLYQKSKFILPLSFWDLLLFNRWHTWWGTRAILADSQWVIFWPVAFFLALIFLILVLLRKMIINDAEKIIFLWVGFFSLMLSAGYTSTRYFLPLTPFLYILAIGFLKKIIKLKIFENRKL